METKFKIKKKENRKNYLRENKKLNPLGKLVSRFFLFCFIFFVNHGTEGYFSFFLFVLLFREMIYF